MNKDKNKWIDDVLGSMEGSERARPRIDLFDKIERELESPEIKVISIRQLGVAVRSEAARSNQLAGHRIRRRHVSRRVDDCGFVRLRPVYCNQEIDVLTMVRTHASASHNQLYRRRN